MHFIHCVCLCVYMCACLLVLACVYVCVRMSVCARALVCVRVCVSVCVCVHVSQLLQVFSYSDCLGQQRRTRQVNTHHLITQVYPPKPHILASLSN